MEEYNAVQGIGIDWLWSSTSSVCGHPRFFKLL